MKSLMWLDRTGGKQTVSNNVRQAAKRFKQRFGLCPDTCKIHKATCPNGLVKVDDIKTIKVETGVLPFNYLIGIEENESI